MFETPGRPLSPLTEAGGSVVGGVLAHVMDASTVEMPPPPPLPRLLPLPKLFRFLYLLLHYLPYQIHVLHCHSVFPLVNTYNQVTFNG